jgi:endo-1,4-beta-xylanase
MAFNIRQVFLSVSRASLILLIGFASSALAVVPAPQNFAGSINSTNAALTWDAVPGADGYNVYVNNNYLTTTLTNAYTDDIVDGNVYNYYVIAFANSDSNTDETQFSARSEQLTLPESAVPDDLTIPPSVPAGLAGNITGTTVTVTWDPSTDDEAVSGYNVYQNNQYLTTVFDTEYVGTVEAGKVYSYSIVAFDTRVNFSANSDRLLLPDQGPIDTTIPPSSPTKLTGDISPAGASSSVSLTWTASTDDQVVAGYNVYENDAYLTTVFDTAYSGSVETDTPYTYYIVAFDFDGNFSERTSPLILPEGTVIEADNDAPAPPAQLSGDWTLNGNTADITLSWTAAEDNVGVAGYNVYENKAYITTVFGTSFSTTVNAGGSYSYTVVAFDAARNFSIASDSLTLPDNGNLPPTFNALDNVVAEAGGTVSILVQPTDVDGDTPGLFIGTLPTGMYSQDNLDGSRTLFWRPLQPDVGIYQIDVTAFDSTDPTLQTQESFVLTIDMPDDPSTIRNEPPGIDLIGEHIVRAGDTVVMEVKATDPNGTVPVLDITNLPAGATFEQHPQEPNIKVLRWTTSDDDLGLVVLNFEAVDSVDSSLSISSSVPITVADPAQFDRDGDTLRTLADAQDLKIGYASLLNYFNRPDADLYQHTAATEFNLVTPENSMKWGYINPEPGQYRFAAADTLMAFADANGMDVHGHTLVWYTSLPQWVQNSALEDREAIMYDFIDTMTDRYDVEIWDVVNEAFEDDGSYRNSTWFQAMGEEHIEKAFRRARAGAPNAQLIYNDYDIAYGDAKTDAVFNLMEDLIADDVPIDGIGFQMHIGSDFTDFDKVETTFANFANLGLDIYITEMDVTMEPGTTAADQANVFSTIATLCLEQAACKALQVWGVTDRYTWLPGTDPLLLDRYYQPKAAYTALQDALSTE